MQGLWQKTIEQSAVVTLGAEAFRIDSIQLLDRRAIVVLRLRRNMRL
jgi:hypothetical protein